MRPNKFHPKSREKKVNYRGVEIKLDENAADKKNTKPGQFLLQTTPAKPHISFSSQRARRHFNRRGHEDNRADDGNSLWGGGFSDSGKASAPRR
jgi:hypothetical protein